MQHYLEHSEFIDWKHPAVAAKVAELAINGGADAMTAERCFIFVHDAIKHSWGYRQGPVTSKASEVLAEGTGYCYVKSHLLAALLRANALPAGLCYQRLILDAGAATYCLHGLNVVYLQQYGWYRIDARGNKTGIAAEFAPPLEQLVFPVAGGTAENDFMEIWSEPVPQEVEALTRYKTVQQVFDNLPD